jgi:hypothetical protein
MTTKRAMLVSLAVLTGSLCACAQPSASSPDAPGGSAMPATSPLTSSPEPSLPPRGPTDKIKKTAWVTGTVTIGGTGRCYSLVTDDGTAYALHAADSTNLVKGSRMRVRTETAKARIACGPGKLVEMTAAEPLR